MSPVSCGGLPTMPIAAAAASGHARRAAIRAACDRGAGHRRSQRSRRSRDGVRSALNGQPPEPPTLRFEISHGTDRRSVDGAVAGRHADRIRRESERAADAVGPPARRRREPRAGWHRGRELAVLVARRTHASAFFADDKLKRIDVAGGTPLVVADAPNGRGGAWNADGVDPVRARRRPRRSCACRRAAAPPSA